MLDQERAVKREGAAQAMILTMARSPEIRALGESFLSNCFSRSIFAIQGETPTFGGYTRSASIAPAVLAVDNADSV